MRRESLRNIIFAKDSVEMADTAEINPGTGYKSSTMSKVEFADGMQFSTVTDSVVLNEILYRITTLLKEIEKNGGIQWSDLTNYEVDNVCLHDSTFYVANRKSGPDYGGANQPGSDSEFWEVATFNFRASTASSSELVIVQNNSEYNALPGELVYCLGNANITLDSENAKERDRIAVVSCGENKDVEILISGKVLNPSMKDILMTSGRSTVTLVFSKTGYWKVLMCNDSRNYLTKKEDGTAVIGDVLTDLFDGKGILEKNTFERVGNLGLIQSTYSPNLTDYSGLENGENGLAVKLSKINHVQTGANCIQFLPDGSLYTPNSLLKYLPAGILLPLSSNRLVPSVLPCCGQELSRDVYQNLFHAIRTMFGEGDGSTTFNLPDLRGKYIRGSEQYSNIGGYNQEGVPNLTGFFGGAMFEHWSSGLQDEKLFSLTNKYSGYAGTSGTRVGLQVDFDASRMNPIYGNSEHVTPETVVIIWCITIGLY